MCPFWKKSSLTAPFAFSVYWRNFKPIFIGYSILQRFSSPGHCFLSHKKLSFCPAVPLFTWTNVDQFYFMWTKKSPLSHTRQKSSRSNDQELFHVIYREAYLFIASAVATATATVAPTMGLLPMPRKPIISTCAGTEEEPANWASECIRPMVSVMP